MPTFGPMRLVDIRHTTIKVWFNGLPATRARRSRYMALSMVMEHALQDRIIRVKPRVQGATAFVGEKKRVFTAEEIHAVLDELPNFARVFFIVQWGGTLRISEALGLDWDAVDLERGVVEVRQQLYAGQITSELKTKRARRLAPLTEDAVGALRALRKAQPSHRSHPGLREPQHGPEAPAREVLRRVAHCLREVGIWDIVPQALRREDLDGYRRATGDLVKAMARGCHSDYGLRWSTRAWSSTWTSLG